MGLIRADATTGKDGRKEESDYLSSISLKSNAPPVQQIAICFGNNYYWAIPTAVADETFDEDRTKTKNIDKSVSYTWPSPNSPPWKEPFKVKAIDENLLVHSQPDCSHASNDDIVEQISCYLCRRLYRKQLRSNKLYLGDISL
jgi:hypothetical protein